MMRTFRDIAASAICISMLVGAVAVAVPKEAALVPVNLEAIGASYWTGMKLSAVHLQGDMAYVLSERFGVIAVDCSVRSKPEIIAKLKLGKIVNGLCAANDHVYIAANQEGLAVVDASDPRQMRLVTMLKLGGYAQAVDVEGHYAYVANDGLQVVDIEDPANPRLVIHLNTDAQAWGVDVENGMAYLAASRSFKGYLQVIDVADPAAPILKTELLVPDCGFLRDVAKSGDVVYGAAESAGIPAWDVTDPGAPVLLGFAEVPGAAYKVSAYGSRAAVPVPLRGEPCGIYVASGSSAAKPVILGRMKSDESYLDLDYAEGYLVAVSSQGTFSVIADLAPDAVATATGFAVDGAMARGIPGKVYSRTLGQYGTEFIVFVDESSHADFPRFAENVPIANQFAAFSTVDLRGLQLEDLKEGFVARLRGGEKLRVPMSELAPLRELYMREIAGLDLYALHAKREALIDSISGIHADFLTERRRLRDADIVFAGRVLLTEENYDFDGEILRLSFDFSFLPSSAWPQVGWKFDRYNDFPSTFPLPCPVATAQKIFSGRPGEIGGRTSLADVYYHVQIGDGMFECVYDRLTSMKLTKVEIEFDRDIGVREIVLVHAAGQWTRKAE